MIRMLSRKLGYLRARAGKLNREANPPASTEEDLSDRLEVNLKAIRQALGETTDLAVRKSHDEDDPRRDWAIVYIDGLVDQNRINECVLNPLLAKKRTINSSREVSGLVATVFSVGSFSEVHDLRTLTSCLLEGNTVFLADQVAMGLALDTAGYEKRSIGQPNNEVGVRGPQRAFVEDIKTNMSLLRQVIRDKDLVFHQVVVGERSKTKVCVCYIRDLASDSLIREISARLKRIDTDSILASGYIEAFIEDNPFSPFPTISFTERPDVVSGKLLEGRAAILVDGNPESLTVPALLVEWFQRPDDYSYRPLYASLIRWFRYLSFFLSIAAPSFYIALTAYHQELIPTPLLITIAATREGSPFPGVFEVLIMGLIFEIIREAGLRMPRQFGQSASIVGGLVLGQAAISSGLVGAPVVMVVALTAITSFVVPYMAEVMTFMRLILLFLTAILGIVGLTFGFLFILIHFACLRSFGVPYLFPIAPSSTSGLGDMLLRAPLWWMRKRPEYIDAKDRIRRGNAPLPSAGSERRERKGNEN